MTSKLSLSSSVSSATSLAVAINSISAATVAADDKQNNHATVTTDDPLEVVLVEQDDITSVADKQTKRSETVGKILYSVKREDRLFAPKSSIAVMKPDVGILSKDFLKNKGREQSIDKQFAIHRKNRAAVDVDVGILSNGRQRGGRWQQQQKAFDTNLHAINEIIVRSLQGEDELPYMCPGKEHSGFNYFDNLFNVTDSFKFIEEGYFPKCSCPSPTTCGPELCECLELNADGDILQCMDPLKQLCEGTKYISGIPGPWSMEECLGSKFRAIKYCSYLPCFVDGGSYWQCKCQSYDSHCTETRNEWSCAKSKCCQAQIDDEGREACVVNGDLSKNYYEGNTTLSISKEEMISRFNECSFDSDSGKSIVQCYCDSFSYGLCVNDGVAHPNLCEAMNCCFEQTEDDARLECFTRFRNWNTGFDFYRTGRDAVQESCVASGKSSDQCKCDIHGLSNCVGNELSNREPRCDLFQCCQSQTVAVDEGRKDCLVQDEAQLLYVDCINYGGSTESCVCRRSSMLCSFGHSDDLHCELSSCCQEQTDDTGRKECIGNFTTSQPSSAPSETTPSPTATSALPGTSSATIPLVVKSHAKTRVLAVAAITVWLLLT